MSHPESTLSGIARAADPAFVTAVDLGGRAAGPMAPAPPESEQRTSRRGVAAVLVGNVGNAAAGLMPPLVALPIYIGVYDPEGKAGSLGLTLGLLALTLLVFTPVFGAISDRTTSRLGMRKPGLLAGTGVLVAGLFIQGLATNVPLLILGATVMAVGSALFTASYSALIPDQVAPASRGRVLGFQSLILVVMGVSASIVGPALIGNQLVLFTAGGGLMIITTLITTMLLKDRLLDKKDVPAQPALRALTDGFAYNPKSAPDFSRVWASRFLVTLGVSFGGFSVYFLTDQLKVSADALPGLISLTGVINLGGTVIGTLGGAFLSDKLGRRKSLVLITGMILAAGGLITAFSPDVPVFMLATAVIAFGLGTFIPIDGALVMDVLPGGKAQTGKYMSIMTIADQLPRAIGPFLAPGVIALGALTPMGGYPVLYLFMGIFSIIGGLVVRKVKNAR
ncbi:MFS transporter [Pseudarthrobacter scleromae]|uniref:MFS transporter n=1 Tax=Pseudarthrobacter scleromae TaxID=158897 RepID=UPI003CFBE343